MQGTQVLQMALTALRITNVGLKVNIALTDFLWAQCFRAIFQYIGSSEDTLLLYSVELVFKVFHCMFRETQRNTKLFLKSFSIFDHFIQGD